MKKDRKMQITRSTFVGGSPVAPGDLVTVDEITAQALRAGAKAKDFVDAKPASKRSADANKDSGNE